MSASLSAKIAESRKDHEYDRRLRELLEKNRQLAKEAVRKKYPDGIWKGKKHTEETKALQSKVSIERGLQKGQNNSQFGTMWITNGIDNKKIKKIDDIPEGWYKGRKL